jgi:intracellular septation protein|tara:strand:- start:322 stop:894 length:573 start_codon:yes stop_codon:yes gene_type:complete
MHAFLEYIPLVIFFVIYSLADIYWATASLIATSALQIVYFIVKRQPVPTKNWIFFGVIAVFGGLTIFLHDDAFIKWKVTIINLLFAFTLIISNKFFNKNLLKKFLGEALTLPEKIWSKLNLSWALFFAFCALLNLYIAFNFDQQTWVYFKVFGLTGLMFIFAIGSIMALYKYLPKDDDPKRTSSTEENNN